MECRRDRDRARHTRCTPPATHTHTLAHLRSLQQCVQLLVMAVQQDARCDNQGREGGGQRAC
jgi:hypothetical protein